MPHPVHTFLVSLVVHLCLETETVVLISLVQASKEVCSLLAVCVDFVVSCVFFVCLLLFFVFFFGGGIF